LVKVMRKRTPQSTFDIVWHGPVADQHFSVEADTEEEAMEQLGIALCENDEEWLDEHRD